MPESPLAVVFYGVEIPFELLPWDKKDDPNYWLEENGFADLEIEYSGDTIGQGKYQIYVCIKESVHRAEIGEKRRVKTVENPFWYARLWRFATDCGCGVETRGKIDWFLTNTWS